MEYVKCLIASLFTGLAAYLHPLTGDLHSLLSIFAINFVVGLLAGIIANGESFNFKKAWRCVVEATIFLLLICAIYFIGEKKGNPSGALQCVSFVTYSVFYFYGVNIFKNLKELLKKGTPAYKVVSFLYYIVSVEFVKDVPFLTNYLNKCPDESK